MKSIIIYSAIKNLKNNKIYLGKNHGEIFNRFQFIKQDYKYLVMGFLTDKLEFLNRMQASKYVIKNKQIKDKQIIRIIKNKELFSEHLLLELYGKINWSEYTD